MKAAIAGAGRSRTHLAHHGLAVEEDEETAGLYPPLSEHRRGENKTTK